MRPPRRRRFPRALFLRALCCVFAAAFASIRSQIRGLYGDDGLEPVAVYLARLVERHLELKAAASTTYHKILAFPTLVWLHEPLQWSPSFTMEVLCLVGMTLSLLGVCNSSWRSALPLAIVWLCYLSIVQCGQTFMHFQWDAFLLEVGFLAIWLAPWWEWQESENGSLQSHSQSHDETFETPAASVWTLRFLFFKFMFMSGSVKVQSRCPTWLGLTALEFHYATQPLPLPLAWYAHQLPPLVNRLAVAATLLLEGPWTFFILAPHLSLRKFAALTQVALQVGILLTGNYNFFNLLTIVMALAVLDENAEVTKASKPNEQKSQACCTSWVARAEAAWQWFQTNSRVAVGMWLATTVYCVYSAKEVFSLSFDNPQETPQSQSSSSPLEQLLLNTRVQFLPSVEETQAWIARVLPVSVNYAAATIVIASLWQLVRFVTRSQPETKSKLRFLVGLVYLVTCSAVNLWTFSSSVLTLAILDRNYQSSLPPVVFSAYSTSQKLHVTSPYGLFRTMTGVGTLSRRDGQQFTVVARPEIILEGTADNGGTWRAYHFKYKPGDVHDRPRLAMPLQPRLDWQMWFAALETDYQSAPWIVHLVHKLLEGSPDVKSLLDASRDPFPDDRSRSPPVQAIRAQLYYYDFTRLNSSWNRRIPNADFVGSGGENENDTRWWTRAFAREYLPPLEKGNPSLLSFVKHHYGLTTGQSDRDKREGACSLSKATDDWWLKSELCAVLRVLVESETAPLWLAAAVLIARCASKWVVKAARSCFRTSPVSLMQFKLKDE